MYTRMRYGQLLHSYKCRMRSVGHLILAHAQTFMSTIDLTYLLKIWLCPIGIAPLQLCTL